MQYRRLGQAGIQVSAIGLGSYLTIGMSIDEAMSRATIHKAYELGINFFDTANAYNQGEAEHVLGRHLAGFRRASLVIATKVYAPMADGPNDRGLSAKHIYEQCHASLKRLQVDYLDLYQCHRPDAATPLAETVQAMEDLARQGKILYWGTSEWPAWLIAKAHAIAHARGARRAVSNQPRYSLLYRQPEAELFQFCRAEGVGNVVFSPLAHGILTGKYTPGAEPPAGTRAADPKQNMILKRLYWRQDYLEKAQQLKRHATAMQVSAAQLALAWVLLRPEVSSAIIGATRVSQVEENAAAAELAIPADIRRDLDELFPGPSETYPIE
ncbi:MAG: voltage-gated potassium channel [Planctomycetes bacterium RBG_16_64_10]|nr:MAG: voltage-gated potassium channel [Planctomycetes bacterium RBG_16_64_10]